VGVLATADIFLFEDFRLDRQGTGLSRRDESGVFVPLSIGARALDVLAVLVERPGELITKEEIMAAVWRRSVVENANLTVQIAALRRVLDQRRADGSCIQTVATRGYRFLPAVTRVEHATAPPKASREAAALQAAPVLGVPYTRPRGRTRPAAIAAAVSMAAIIGAGTFWWAWTTTRSPTARTPIARSTEEPIPPRLSIVVLPFTDLSEDRGQQYFADGITDDLTTDLSRLNGAFVIARNTAFTYKDKPIDAKQIGRELGVRYVLEGSVRRSGNQVRVNAQLIEAATDTYLWAERFDHDVGELLAMQNEVTGRIANTLGWELLGAETARPTERPDALDYILRGRAAMWGGGPRGNIEDAIVLFEQALALDPRSVEAQTRLAFTLWARAGRKDPKAAAADLQRAEELLAQALVVSPGDPNAHLVKGRLLRSTHRCAQAIPEFEITLAANRNNPNALGELSVCKYLTGGPDQEAIALTEQAIRLSPRDPGIWWWYSWIGFVHLLQSRIDEAIVWLEKGRSAQPNAAPPHFFLAAAYGFKGEQERARAELGEAQTLTGSDRYSSVARTRANGDLYTPALRDRWETVYFPGIRNAGLPAE
jgi:TolB-like protein/DNA-binding winged helix-turn-helix (wHTH) protein/Tfp pilus assembly protein PilF